MGQESSPSLQEVFQRAERGDAEAREALFALLYDELHRLAHANVARARGAMTWNTTTLLHEAYLGLAQREGLRFPDENRFLGYAARAMRGLVIDAIRTARASGMSWSAIGAFVGTSGEAARQRYADKVA